MALKLTRFDDVDTFEASAFPFLLEREAEHNLFIGICGQIREGRYSEAYLAAVADDDRVVGAAWMTPPHNLGISHVDDVAALDVLADDIRDAYGTVPGVLASTEVARRFVTIWSGRIDGAGHLHMPQRIYECTQVSPPSGVPGEARMVTAGDRDLLITWRRAFAVEAVGETDTASERSVDNWLNDEHSSGCVVWCDPDPVSMVGFGSPSPNGMRIAPVYTPPEVRGHGYASACTAEATRRILSGRRRFVFLYTDLNNPTSNSIYQKIGYCPVCDVEQWRFD
jgi:predicted GNAT family acetyltransferase